MDFQSIALPTELPALTGPRILDPSPAFARLSDLNDPSRLLLRRLDTNDLRAYPPQDLQDHRFTRTILPERLVLRLELFQVFDRRLVESRDQVPHLELGGL